MTISRIKWSDCFMFYENLNCSLKGTHLSEYFFFIFGIKDWIHNWRCWTGYSSTARTTSTAFCRRRSLSCSWGRGNLTSGLWRLQKNVICFRIFGTLNLSDLTKNYVWTNVYSDKLILSSQDNRGIQWVNYRCRWHFQQAPSAYGCLFWKQFFIVSRNSEANASKSHKNPEVMFSRYDKCIVIYYNNNKYLYSALSCVIQANDILLTREKKN